MPVAEFSADAQQCVPPFNKISQMEGHAPA